MTARIGLVLLLVAAPALFAQTTASLTGIITSGGKPLPGVIVTLRSDALQGTRTTTTSEELSISGGPGHDYLGGRGALRTDNAFSTDVALRSTLGRFFAQADILNIFDNDALFDPRAQTPAAGVNCQVAANFAQALNNLAYQ